MKIAIFKNISGDGFTFDMIVKHEDVREGGIYTREYAQLTEWVDVEFPPLPAQTVVESQLKLLDTAETELRNKFQRKLDELANERSRLLSLTHEVAA